VKFAFTPKQSLSDSKLYVNSPQVDGGTRTQNSRRRSGQSPLRKRGWGTTAKTTTNPKILKMTQKNNRVGRKDRYALRRRRLLGVAGGGLAASIVGCTSNGDDDASGDDIDESEDTEDSQDEDGTEEGNGEDSSDEDTTEEGNGEDSQDEDGTEEGNGEDSEEDSEEENDEEDVEPASFEIVEVNHPEEVEVGETHTFSFTVENTGGEDGTFEELLEISVGGTDEWESLGQVQLDIPAGETATWESNSTDFDNPAVVQFRLGETEWSYEVTITAPDTQSFSGSGEEVRRDISIEGGLTVVQASHSGESNFQVSLVNDSEFDDNFINVIGDFDGAQADLIEGGEYILDVNADGSWEIDIRQPRSGQGDSLPVSFSGSGPDVVGPVQFSGTGVATGEHDGESNFQVQIYPMTGSFGELVFNEIGSFSGETAFSFNNVGWIDVNADGSWSVEFE